MIAAGTRLGPYEVVSPLGAGGMGEVWRARDTRLSREVAVKVLPAEVSSDPSRLKRFEKEARTASALNHPNIVTIYDTGTTDSVAWIAMEKVDGKTLREILIPGPLGIRRLLALASQVADGLAKAHEAGIVHRDLKPENVMVTKDGLVKILDFGLAKLAQVDSGSGEASHLPTETGTSPGAVLGTVGYMSPEQAAGQPVDFRSDQFSFGSILYEMATGMRAFLKGTAVDTLSAILHEDPKPVAESNAEAPAPFRWLVERCLAKDPEERYGTTRDLARELATIRDRLSEAAVPGAAAPASRWRSPARLWAAGGLAALALAAVSIWVGRATGRAATSSSPTFRQVTFRKVEILRAKFAPDGQTIVYAARAEGRPPELFSTRLGSPESRSLGLPPAVILSISSAGEMAILLHGPSSTLARVSLAGGAPREILDSVGSADWSPDGKSLAVNHYSNGKYRVEFPVGKVLYETGSSFEVRVARTGDKVVINDENLKVVNLAGKVVDLGERGSDPVWSPKGDEVWFQKAKEGATQIFAMTLSGRKRLVASIPGDFVLQDIARDGRLLEESATERFQILGHLAGESEDRDFSWQDRAFANDLSADGRTLLFTLVAAGWSGGAAYLRKTDGSPPVRLAETFGLALSPDGRWALCGGGLEKLDQLMLVPTGAGEARPISQGGLRRENPWWANFLPDGKRIVFSASAPGGGAARIYVLDLADGKPRAITPEGVYMRPHLHSVSPDGRLVLGVRNQIGAALYPIDGGESRAIPGLAPGDDIFSFADDRTLYGRHPGDETRTQKVWRLDLVSGEKTPWKEIRLVGGSSPFLLISRDGESYVASSSTWLSDLFVVEGLK